MNQSPGSVRAKVLQMARDLDAETAMRADGAQMVALIQKCGFHPDDIDAFVHFTAEEQCLIISRCPNPLARGLHGRMKAKPEDCKGKTTHGYIRVVDKEGRGDVRVSDYDLMCFYQYPKGSADKPSKVHFSARGIGGDTDIRFDDAGYMLIPRGSWSPLATSFLLKLNPTLKSKIQHGCQDDFNSIHNPGIKDSDSFIAFCKGMVTFIPNPAACIAYYREKNIHWPYEEKGKGGLRKYTGIRR
ncbi:MAG: hypothetical protein MI976_28680 [Pseudomonadales bacterium]|nr:hypothetical protein [Pseudomonadales bacterium]